MTASDDVVYNNQFLTPQTGYCSTNTNGKKHRREKPLTTIYWKDLENLICRRNLVLHLVLMNIIHSHSKYREVNIFTTFLFQKKMKGTLTEKTI